VFPAAAYLEMALRAASDGYGVGAHELEDVAFREVLVVPSEGERVVQITTSEMGGDRLSFKIRESRRPRPRPPTAPVWTTHAEGLIRRGGVAPERLTEPLDAIRARCTEAVDGQTFYDVMRSAGLEYGPRFQGIRSARRHAGEGLAELVVPAPGRGGGGVGTRFIPRSSTRASRRSRAPRPRPIGGTYVPVGLRRLRLLRPLLPSLEPPRALIVAYARLGAASDGAPALEGDLVLCDEDGVVIAIAEGLRAARIGNAKDERSAVGSTRVSWEAQPRPDARQERRSGFLLVASGGDERLADALRGRGQRVVVVPPGANAAAVSAALANEEFDAEHPCRGVVVVDAGEIAKPTRSTARW